MNENDRYTKNLKLAVRMDFLMKSPNLDLEISRLKWQ